MTEYDAKTILFGALIVAMILPFLATDMAEAQKTNRTDPRILEIERLKAELLDSVKNSTMSEEQILTMERYDLAIQFFEQENLGFPNQTKIDQLALDLHNNLAYYNLTYTNAIPMEDSEGVGAKKSSHDTTSFRTTSVHRFNCDTQGRDFGSASGNIRHNDRWSVMTSILSFPSYIADGNIIECKITNWSSGVITYSQISNPGTTVFRPDLQTRQTGTA